MQNRPKEMAEDLITKWKFWNPDCIFQGQFGEVIQWDVELQEQEGAHHFCPQCIMLLEFLNLT